MATGERQLSHSEIWDDSALISSWDEALEEYKKYHSIHINGGNVNDLLSQAEKEEGATPGDDRSRILDAKHDKDEMDESPDVEVVETASEIKQDSNNDVQETNNTSRQQSRPRLPSAPAPEGILGTVRDEGLKRLLMSWYYAGYYTGLYEGQRDSSQNQTVSEQK
ncbi:hypothetical protein F5Y17DRAFT_461209 [Xylariaceae sp. FL0594]|nr:hypothetical protein F5Y17DRAFT_461209 [Xylariaceae sp. FL0594]